MNEIVAIWEAHEALWEFITGDLDKLGGLTPVTADEPVIVEEPNEQHT